METKLHFKFSIDFKRCKERFSASTLLYVSKKTAQNGDVLISFFVFCHNILNQRGVKNTFVSVIRAAQKFIFDSAKNRILVIKTQFHFSNFLSKKNIYIKSQKSRVKSQKRLKSQS